MCHSTGMPLCTALPSFSVTLSVQITQLLLSRFSFFSTFSFSLHNADVSAPPFHFSRSLIPFSSLLLSPLPIIFFCNPTSPAFSLYVHDVVDTARASIRVSCISSTLIRCGYCLTLRDTVWNCLLICPRIGKVRCEPPLCSRKHRGLLCVYVCAVSKRGERVQRQERISMVC